MQTGPNVYFFSCRRLDNPLAIHYSYNKTENKIKSVSCKRINPQLAYYTVINIPNKVYVKVIAPYFERNTHGADRFDLKQLLRPTSMDNLH